MKNIIYIIITATLLMSSCKKENKTEPKLDDGHNHSETSSVDKNNHDDDDDDDENVKVSKAQFESSKMEIGTLTEQNFPEIVKATGMIDVPPQSIEIISSFYGGFIKKSNLLIGDNVRKGQAVVTIENPEFVDMQQNYLETKEQISYLKSEYERQKTLYDEQITSQKNYLKAESEYKRKVATLKGLSKKLKMLNISPSRIDQGNITSTITLYSSISGSISEVNVSKGTHISPADEIMKIINTNHIHIELLVFEKDAMKIKKNQVIRFKIPEASDEYYDAEVHLVGKSIDEKNRTVKVHGHLHHETKNKFDIGMFVEADIEIQNKKAIALPEDAIIEEGDDLVVLKQVTEDNGNLTFKPVRIKIGKKHNGFVEIITDKILKTDKILIKGGYSLVGAEGGGHSH